MDVAETVAQLKAAQETAKALSDAAQAQSALPLKANAAQESFAKAIDPQQEGKFTGSVGGQEAKKAQPGSRELGKPTERFAQPFIVNEAPADIGFSSPASTQLFAGGSLHATVQQDWHVASAHRLLTAVRAKDWANIAYYYNGSGYETNSYDNKMENAYKKFKNIA
jgi:type VI secretion system secreted protein VgrG